jgi:hypothetical protein
MKAQTNIKFSTNLFWDADPDDLDLNKHKAYVVGRVLDYGEWNDWLAIQDFYGMDELKNIALRIRTMFPTSADSTSNCDKNQYKDA